MVNNVSDALIIDFDVMTPRYLALGDMGNNTKNHISTKKTHFIEKLKKVPRDITFPVILMHFSARVQKCLRLTIVYNSNKYYVLLNVTFINV